MAVITRTTTKKRRTPSGLTRLYAMIGVIVVLMASIFIFRSATGTRPFQDLVLVISITLAFSTPITLGSLAGTFSERSGVVNIGIEGMMLTGAFFGALVSAATGIVWLGVIAAIVSGMALSLIHAVLSIYFRVDQVISGTVINIFAFGLTSYLNNLIVEAGTTNNQVARNSGKLPILLDIPPFSLGTVTFISIVAVFVSHYVLFYTTWGLRTRAVGENPKAADAAGISVYRIRYLNVLISGALSGLGGLYFSLQSLGGFTNNMTVGYGFIALAAMIFGKYTPFGAWSGALLFGFCLSLYTAIQSWNLDVSWLRYVTQSLPYLVTIIVLTGVVGRSRAPAADGIPYVKS